MAELPTRTATHSRARRVLRWLAYAAGTVIVLLVIAVVALQSGQARRFILNRATTLLAQQHIAFSTRDFRYNVLGLSTEMRGIKIYSPDLPGAPPFLEIDHAKIDLNTWQALRGRYVIRGSGVENVRVHYFVNEQGVDNLPRPVNDPNDQSQPIDYLIASLDVPNAVVRYENRAQHIDVTIPRASMTVKGNPITDRHDVTIEAPGGDARLRDRTAHLDRISLALDLGRDDVKVQRAEVEAEGVLLNASGRVGPFEQPLLDLSVQATADAARAADVAQVNESVSGQVSVEGTVKGPITALAMNGHITGNDLQFRDLNGIDLDADAGYQAGQEVVRVSNLHLSGPIGTVGGDGVIAIRGSEPSRLNANVQGLHAEPVMRALRLPYRVASRADGQVSAQWPGLDYAKAVGNAKLSLTPAAASASRSTLPVAGRIDVAGDGTRVTAKLDAVQAAGADINGRILVVDRDRLDGTVSARAANLQATVSALEAFLGRRRGSLVPVPISGMVTADGRVGGRVSAPQLTAHVNAPALNVGDATGVGVDGDLAYRTDALAVNRFDVAWRDARAHATGTIGLRGRQAIDLSVRADALPVEGLFRAMQLPNVPLTGTVMAQAHVGGTAANPLANLHLQASDLIAYNETLGALNADGRYANRQLDVTTLTLDKPQPGGNGRVTGTGSYQFGTQRYAINLQSENVKLQTLTLPDGRVVTGALDVRADAAGTVPNPAGAISLRADGLVVGDYQIGKVTSDTTLADGRATTTTIADRLALTAKSTIETKAPYAATIQASVNNLDLANLPVTLQTPLEGRLKAELTAAGPLSAPRRGQADATVDAFSGSWRQKPFKISGPAHFQYAGERLTIDRLLLEAEDSTIAVSGNLPLVDRNAPGALTIDANANLATLVQYAPVGTDLAADGRLTVKGTLVGTLKAIDPNLQIALVNALVLSPAIEPGVSNLNATATIANGEANVSELTANWGAAQIAMSARVPLDLLPELPVEIPRQAGPAQIHARLDNLNPSAIPGAPSGLSGRISFDADVESRRPTLRDAQGKIAFRELELGFQGLSIEQKQPSTIAVRNGVAQIDSFALSGSVGTLTATGSVGLVDERPIAVDVGGNVNIAAISLITDRVRAEGDSVIDIAARGTVADPLLSGNVTINDGMMVVEDPRIAAEAINARIDLNQNRVNLSTLTADVNGGTVSAKGVLAVRDRGLQDLDLQVALRDFAYDAPLDLRSLSDSDLRINSSGDDIVVSGQVTIQEAGLTGDINFDTGLLASITARPQLELTPQRNPLLERVVFNVNVDTNSPILVDNNLAKAEVSTDLRLVGTPYETGLLGKVEVAEGGMVTLNERTYEIQRGDISFVDDRRIYPSFNLSMTTTANNYDITLGITGEPGNTETTLTSSPMLPEPDIMAMLVTGRTLEQMRGAEYDVAREEVLSYLTGRVGSTIGRQLRQATGLSEVRIEPQLIANETNPGARLTLGEDVTDNLTLTYSVNLANSNDQIWLATYDVTKRFQTRAVREKNNTYRVDFRHDIRMGGQPEPRRQPRIRPNVASISVPDDAPIAAAQLRKMLGAEAGQSLDYFAVRNGVEDIEKKLRDAGWAQSRVRLDRSADADGIAIRLRITRGPQVEFAYAGATPPKKIQDEVRQQWHRGVFDAQRTDDTAEVIRQWLMGDDYLQAKVHAQVDDRGPNRRVVHFTVTPGPRSNRVLLEFQGAAGIRPGELNEVIKEQKLERQLYTDPTVVTELLKRLYREQGYLNVEIDKPRYEFDADVARVVVAIREGPQFRISDVTMSGNAAIATSMLQTDLPVAVGDPYMPAAAENALQHIRDAYWTRGYNDVRATYQLTLDRIGGRVGVAFRINEGRQAIVSDVRIAGNDKTTEHLVREELAIKPAEPLDLKALSRSRKNLYDSGAFSIVDLSRDTVTEAKGSALVGAIVGPTQKPVQVDVAVREVQPYQFRYGASYDSEGRLGGVFDASVHNVLGKARVVGIASRYDRLLHEGRLYMSQPTLRYWPIQTTASIYYTEERNQKTSISDAYNVDRKGIALTQDRKLKDSYIWTYGYRFERARTFDPNNARPEVLTVVSPLTSAFVRDVRDDVLDATRGSFNSQALSFSPKWLGSDDTYIKYLGQYFHYFPLQKERRKRFSNEIIRPRLVFASAFRLGLSKGMGTFVPSTERFFAGGSTTLRGFEQNSVGPIGADGKPLGGDAMLVMNHELRFPLISLVDGVVFSDIGNVWQKSTDFSLGDLRETSGFGVRLRTKWVLIRGDYGFVLNPRPGERRRRFYFSIGQAF